MLLSYQKGKSRFWKEKNFENLYDDIIADYLGWDYEQDDEVNYEKLKTYS